MIVNRFLLHFFLQGVTTLTITGGLIMSNKCAPRRSMEEWMDLSIAKLLNNAISLQR